ncbi:MAG TPA: acyl transferase [Flavobacteriales bacterium]|nr:acyl transferase [Flavobacteriales bacterium]
MPAFPPYLDPRLLEQVFEVDDDASFNALALELFHLHAAYNPVYRGFLNGLGVTAVSVDRLEAIPFLPISAFKNHRVLLEGLDPTSHFTSSGTTGAATSVHHVPWPSLYERSFMRSFTRTYGDPATWRIVALLPAYLEREGSSLVYMAQRLIEATGDPFSGTYLYKYDEVSALLHRSEDEGKPTLLLGVTFALLDLAERFPQPLPNTVIMETGGMKGRRPEIVRDELHRILKKAFHVPAIHSEYGMTELLSQAWSQGEGRYSAPSWMRILVRDPNDPLGYLPHGRTGGLNVIDLANVASCPFIATQDLGRMYTDGTFEVLGRFDHSDLRGCNLLMEA